MYSMFVCLGLTIDEFCMFVRLSVHASVSCLLLYVCLFIALYFHRRGE